MESLAPAPASNAPRAKLPALLTIDEAATVARTSPSSVRHWIATGRLNSVRPGRRRLIPLVSLALFLGTSAADLAA